MDGIDTRRQGVHLGTPTAVGQHRVRRWCCPPAVFSLSLFHANIVLVPDECWHYCTVAAQI